MRAYDIKRGHHKTLEGDGLQRILEEAFGAVTAEGDAYRVSFGAIKKMRVRLQDKQLVVDKEMDPEVDEETAAATVRANNAFLKEATGFTSKQRRDRLQKAAKEG